MSETIVTVINSIGTILGILGVGTGVGAGILFFSQNKRMKEAEARMKEIEAEAKQSLEWKKLYDVSDADSREKDTKIDKLYDERQELLHKIIEIERRSAVKDIKIAHLEYERCDNNDCNKRHPPRIYGRANTDTLQYQPNKTEEL